MEARWSYGKHETLLMKRLLLGVVLLSYGCATEYVPVKNAEVRQTKVTKIETPLAAEFCAALLETPTAQACAVWTSFRRTCVIVMPPADGRMAMHEGAHCLGYDHPN